MNTPAVTPYFARLIPFSSIFPQGSMRVLFDFMKALLESAAFLATIGSSAVFRHVESADSLQGSR